MENVRFGIKWIARNMTHLIENVTNTLAYFDTAKVTNVKKKVCKKRNSNIKFQIS